MGGRKMNKRDIINKLQTDQKALEVLLASQFASDLQIKLESKLEYVKGMLEYITQEGKV
jgi:hypothetical protein